MASQDHAPSTGPALDPRRAESWPEVQCDLCGLPMPLPEHCKEQGEVLGLLVCAQCIEDHLDATTNEPRSEVGMVGGGH